MSLEPQSGQSAVSLSADEARTFAIECARLAAESRMENVVVLELSGLSSLADYFIIGSGTSDRQMRAVLGYIEEYARTVGRRPYKPAEARDTSWMLADYIDVVIHLFDEEHRAYYDLEGLWGDAPRVPWGEPEPA